MTCSIDETTRSIDPSTSHEQADILNAVLDHLTQGMAVVGPDYRVLAINRQFDELFQLPIGTVEVGADFRDILKVWAEVTGQDQQMLDRAILQLDSTTPFEYEFPQQIMGEPRWCLLTHNPLPGKGFARTFTDITERKQAEDVLRHRTGELSLLLEVTKNFSATLDLKVILQTATDRITELTDLESAAIYLLSGEMLRLCATAPPLPPQFPEELRLAPLADHPHIAKAIASRKPFFLLDALRTNLTDAERAVTDARGLRSILYLPLMVGADVLGVLIVCSVEESRELSEEEQDLCQTLANVAAMAIANGQLYESSQAYGTELEKDITERKRAEVQLQDAYEFNNQIIQHAKEGVIVYGLDLRYRVWNSFMEQLSGKPASEVLGKHPLEVFPFLSDVGLIERLERVLAGEMVDSIDFPFKFPAIGKSGWTTDTSAPLRNSAGEITGVIGTVSDITERKLAEEKLRNSEESLAITLHSIGDAVVATDLAGLITRMNPTAERLTGWSLTDASGRPLAEVFRIINALTREPCEDPVQKVLAHGEVVGLANHTVLLARDGQEYQISDSAAPIRDAMGQIVGVVLVFSDVTEKYQVEDALRESESLLKESQRVAHIGSYRTDFTKGFWTSSTTLDQIFGIDSAYDRSIRGWVDIVHPDDQETLARYLNDEILGQRKPFDKEYRIVRKSDGVVRWVHGLGEVAFDSEGTPISLTGTIMDITERRQAEEKLRNSEESLAITLHSIGDAVVATDLAGLITRMNPTAERLTGWSLTDASGRPLAEVFRIINALTRELSEDPVQKVLAHGEVVGLANHTVLLARDGQEYQISDSAAPIRDAMGKIVGVVLVFSDVTEKYRVEEALARTTELLKNATEIAKIGGWELELASMKLTWSLGTYRLHELDPLTPVDVSSGIHFYAPEAQPVIAAAVQAAIETGTPYDLELPLLTAKGRTFWARAQCSPVTENGRVIKLVGAFQDITERKLAEDELNQTKAILQAAMDQSPVGIAIADAPNGILRYVNQAGLLMRGGDLETILHGVGALKYVESWRLLDLDGRPLEMLEVPLARAVLLGESCTREFMIHREDGDHVTVRGVAAPIRNAEGEVVSGIVVFEDISQAKRTEAVFQSMEKQLQQSQKMESLGTLAGGVAHDMNNVLGAILGLASVHIGTQPHGSPLHQALDTICKAADRGGKMVKSLLGFARQNPAESTKLDMNMILREQVALLERTILAKVRLEIDLEAALRPILGDASALTNAFMNLCVNAVDAMPENGTLTLHTRNVDNDWIEVVVEDNGTGMPKEVLDKAMEPFFTTKGTGKGTGLGLSMVFSTVKAHRGQMAIESEPDKGTRVMMRFPACEHEATAQAVATVVTETTLAPHGTMKVLLIDDDDLIRSSVEAILEVLGHTSVNIAQSGEEALALLEAGFEPDLVILDMNMPGLGGIGTLPRLRMLRPEVPVLLATGRVDQTALTLASAHLGVTLLSKPFGLRELQKHLENIGLA